VVFEQHVPPAVAAGAVDAHVAPPPAEAHAALWDEEEEQLVAPPVAVQIEVALGSAF